MAKAWQSIMTWGFISICFLKFWTYVAKGQKQSNEVGDLLKWQREEITKLQEVLKAKHILNKKQCVNLVHKLDQVVHGVNDMIMIFTNETSNKFGFVLEELCRITRRVGVLVEDCGKQEWCHAVAFQMNNTEAFRELVDDLKCFWDAIGEKYLATCLDSQNHILAIIHFNVATCEEIGSDEKALETRLKEQLDTMPNDIGEYKLTKHLLRRLQFDLQGVKGAELDAMEVPKDVTTPILLKPIGSGAAGEVYKSSWLGLQSATKILEVMPKVFRKEAGILACLSHPSLIKFICCGRFNLPHEVDFVRSSNVSRTFFLVMELMDMSLSHFLKKQKTPLPYFVTIDIMHEIARGMCYLHDMHVAHLDLKPDNVLLSSIPRVTRVERYNYGYDFVKLTDYDASKTDVRSKPELQKYTIGTPKYMAPEMNNMNKEIPPSNVACPFQADVWSFAMTCSEILSLKEPFLDTSMDMILQKIQDCVRPELPINCEELTMLIEECWLEDPSQRPTFSNICKRLVALKKKFIVGTYLNDKPQFDKDETTSQNKQRKASNYMNISTPKKVDERRTQDEVVVGLESNLENVRDHLKRVNILGLIGMGGIGKTTLAKAIFYDVRSTYDGSCFIENMKSKSSLDISREIIKNFEIKMKPTWELVDAQNQLRELLSTKKILLILDDAKDAAQVDDIIPANIPCVKNGTKIIITTRVWGVIKNHLDVNGKIDVGTLNKTAAKQLFNSFVSSDEAHLSPQFIGLRDKIVEACNGLPLSLKVMGAFLRGKERIRSWERALQRIKRGRCLDGDEELWRTLRISFDDLGINEKTMFLDLACFFRTDMKKKEVLHICTNYKTSPNDVLDTLVDMSLVKIDRHKSVEMHDQLRDMGRMIVETDKEYMSTRIWKKNSILLGCSGSIDDKNSKRIEAIYLNEEILQWLLDNCTNIQDVNMSSLRLLICWRLETLPERLVKLIPLKTLGLSSSSRLTILPEELRNLPSSMTLVFFKCFGLRTLPEGLWNMTSLTTLNLEGCSSLKTLPEALGNLVFLTSLNLNGCSSLTTLPEELGNLTALTTLNLEWCSRLTTLPEGLGNLTALTTLNLGWCHTLTTLPEGLENLTSLTTLNLEGCASLTTLLEGLGNLTALITLNLTRCERLTTLPEGLGNLISLRSLNLEECARLTTLPIRLGNLISLVTLNLKRWANLTTLPDGLGNLTSLTTLYLKECVNLTTLPEGLRNLTSLTTLNLEGCVSLTTLPEGLGNLTSLTTLNLEGCVSLTTLPEGLGNLTSLTTLNLEGCVSLTTLPEGLENLTTLTSLNLKGCGRLTTLLNGLGNLTSLTRLNLERCWRLTTLPEGLGNLTALTTLNLTRCEELTTLPEGLGNLTSLRSLNLEWCKSLKTLPEGLGNLTYFKSLDLKGCVSLKTLPEGLGNLTSLRSLNLEGCVSLTTLLEGLGNLTSLTTLDLEGCASLTTLPKGLANLTSLRSLNLEGCVSLTTLVEGLGNLTSLTTLDLEGCASLTTLPKGLANLTSMTSVIFKGCANLTTLPEGLENFTLLTSLIFHGCGSLRTLPEALWSLTPLTILNLEGCSSLTTLGEGLGNLTSLTSLNLHGCTSLITLPEGLGSLATLTYLSLQTCSTLRTLPERLENLTSLTSLILRSCSSLTVLPEGLGNLTSLTSLNMRSCSSLTILPEGLENLTSLTSLVLEKCSKLTKLPEGLGNLTNLTTLNLRSCSCLRTLPEGLGNLTSLSTLILYKCTSLTTLPDGFGNLTALRTSDLETFRD